LIETKTDVPECFVGSKPALVTTVALSGRRAIQWRRCAPEPPFRL